MELTVCFWNILFDVNQPSRVKSQSGRLPDIIKTLQIFPNNTIMGLAEVEGTNNEVIARRLGSKVNYFVEHDRPDDHIGVLSDLSLSPKAIQIDENCQAVIVEHHGVIIVAVHMTLALFDESFRKKQIRTLLSKLDPAKPTVIMGDFNSLYWQASRKLIRAAGFSSALNRTAFKRLPTAPTQPYRHILQQPLKALGRRGFTLDDIYVKDLEVTGSGIFEGESDHRGVWATVRLA